MFALKLPKLLEARIYMLPESTEDPKDLLSPMIRVVRDGSVVLRL